MLIWIPDLQQISMKLELQVLPVYCNERAQLGPIGTLLQ